MLFPWEGLKVHFVKNKALIQFYTPSSFLKFGLKLFFETKSRSSYIFSSGGRVKCVFWLSDESISLTLCVIWNMQHKTRANSKVIKYILLQRISILKHSYSFFTPFCFTFAPLSVIPPLEAVDIILFHISKAKNFV